MIPVNYKIVHFAPCYFHGLTSIIVCILYNIANITNTLITSEGLNIIMIQCYTENLEMC